MATEIPMTFVRTAFAIVPADDATAEWFHHVSEGETVSLCEAGESTKLLRRMFAAFGQVAALHPQFVTGEDVLAAVKVAIGHGHRYTTPDGLDVFRDKPTPKRPKQLLEFWRDACEAMTRLGWVTGDDIRDILGVTGG